MHIGITQRNSSVMVLPVFQHTVQSKISYAPRHENNRLIRELLIVSDFVHSVQLSVRGCAHVRLVCPRPGREGIRTMVVDEGRPSSPILAHPSVFVKRYKTHPIDGARG